MRKGIKLLENESPSVQVIYILFIKALIVWCRSMTFVARTKSEYMNDLASMKDEALLNCLI